MEEVLNNLILLLSNGLATYITYRFMYVFFEKRTVDKKVAVLAYLLQYMISVVVIVWFPYPIINIFIAPICYFMVAMCYEGKIIKKVVVAAIIHICSVAIEGIIALAMNLENIQIVEKNSFESYITVVIQCVMWLITVVLEEVLKRNRKNEYFPVSFTLSIIGEIMVIIVMEFLIFQQKNINNNVRIISMVVVVSAVFLIVCLYVSMAKVAEEQAKNQMIKREKEYYHNQAELLQNSSEELREFRHDLKNRMLVLHELLEKNEMKKATGYLQGLETKIEEVENFSQSGNVVIDSVINYKLSQAEKQGCNIQTDISLPDIIHIEDDDLVVVIGNLLDNAMEAVRELKENKYIQVKIKYDRECLVVKIVNSFDGKIMIKRGKIQTRKENREFHGIGLQSVKNVVDKYQGDLQYEYKDNRFSVVVLIYSLK